MVFYLLIGLCLAYEIHKLLDFGNFSKLYLVMVKYSKEIKNRSVGTFTKAVLKVSTFNLLYYVLLIIGIFGSNSIFFSALMILSITNEFIMKKTNRKWGSIIFKIDAILSGILLIAVLVNYFFYQMNGLEFIKYLISLIQ